MKRMLLSLLLALPVSAPAEQAAENIRVAEAMIDAINVRDLDALDALVAPDVVRLSAATAGVEIDSLEDFKQFLRSDFAAVPDSRMTVEVVFADDEHVGMRVIYAGTQTGPMGPFPPSGKRFSLPFIGILAVEDGRIQRIWVEWDNVHVLTQLGHLPPPGE